MIRYMFNRLFRPEVAREERQQEIRDLAIKHQAARALTVLACMGHGSPEALFHAGEGISLACRMNISGRMELTIAHQDNQVLRVMGWRTHNYKPGQPQELVNALNQLPYHLIERSIMRAEVWESALDFLYQRACKVRALPVVRLPRRLRLKPGYDEIDANSVSAMLQAKEAIRRISLKSRTPHKPD